MPLHDCVRALVQFSYLNQVLEDKLKLNQVMISGVGATEHGIVTIEHDKLQ